MPTLCTSYLLTWLKFWRWLRESPCFTTAKQKFYASNQPCRRWSDTILRKQAACTSHKYKRNGGQPKSNKLAGQNNIAFSLFHCKNHIYGPMFRKQGPLLHINMVKRNITTYAKGTKVRHHILKITTRLQQNAKIRCSPWLNSSSSFNSWRGIAFLYPLASASASLQ